MWDPADQWAALLAARGNEEEVGALQFRVPLGNLCDLLRARAPLLQRRQPEAGAQERRDVAGDRSVLFDDPGGQPVGRSRALTELAVDRPDHSARSVSDELRVRWRSADGVLHGEHEPSTRSQRPVHRTKEPVEVCEVAQRQ